MGTPAGWWACGKGAVRSISIEEDQDQTSQMPFGFDSAGPLIVL